MMTIKEKRKRCHAAAIVKVNVCSTADKMDGEISYSTVHTGTVLRAAWVL